MSKIFDELDIVTPKQSKSKRIGTAKWYPYYAGFSHEFALRLIKSAKLSDNSVVFDPWNGSGTSTLAASELNIKSIGYDLNPVMAIIAKARLISVQSKDSLLSMALDIVKLSKVKSVDKSDPLCLWFIPSSVGYIRSIEQRIKELLVDESHPLDFVNNGVDCISDIACFFYVAMFKTIRSLMRPFTTSNPTWIKKPKSVFNRIKPLKTKIDHLFVDAVENMVEDITFSGTIETQIGVSSSTDIPLGDNTIDFVLSSPPYCTRIDYAAATSPELALLKFDYVGSFKNLRNNLIGTTSIQKEKITPIEAWGGTCIGFLEKVKAHKSKASLSYYYRNYVQYFSSVADSCSEISRILTTNGQCHLIVQDSYYKGIHNDLPKIISEMMLGSGLKLIRSKDFIQRSSMANKNPNVAKYRKKTEFNERVLCFSK